VPAPRATAAALLALSAALVPSSPALAKRPPLPTAAGGATVRRVATGVTNPTAFAFGRATVFAGGGPADGPGQSGASGVFAIAHGRATRVPGTEPVALGLAWHRGRLYVSAGYSIVSYGGWNGRRFASRRLVATGPEGFPGFNGLAFGPDGRLYAGVELDPRYDHASDPAPMAQSVVSMRPDGAELRVVARGLRQPFQLAFPAGAAHPYVTVLAQDRKRPAPPDAIVVARPGQDYGFPACTWLHVRACAGFATPLALLPAHASPMGIAARGRTLYVALFEGRGKRGPEVVTLPVHGGRVRRFASGFPAPVIGLGLHRRTVYVGDITGAVYAISL
jgi:glucose/arabinose dehydrogenase